MHCDMPKIQDGGSIVEKLNSYCFLTNHVDDVSRELSMHRIMLIYISICYIKLSIDILLLTHLPRF